MNYRDVYLISIWDDSQGQSRRIAFLIGTFAYSRELEMVSGYRTYATQIDRRSGYKSELVPKK